MALYGTDIPLEDSGIYLHILHIMYIEHILYHDILLTMIYTYYIFPFAGHSDHLTIFKSAVYYALSDEELKEILSCDSEPVLKAHVHCLFLVACSLWKIVMPVEASAVFQNDVFTTTGQSTQNYATSCNTASGTRPSQLMKIG